MASLKQLSNEWYLATALYDAIDDENLRAITSLVQERNANPNVIIPDYGYTPLHLAVGHENENFGEDVTKLLMRNGGDPNVAGIDGVTPLHVAVAWNRAAVAQLLLSYGADPWIKDDSEKDAFDYAQEQQALDTFRALEAFRRSKHGNNYKIKLAKVIIHSNDVQAEYRAINDPCPDERTQKNLQSVSTQTPCPFVKSPTTDSDEQLTEDFDNDSSGTSRGFDRRYDWCDKSEGVILTEECKRAIYRHRARSSMFEYSPRRAAYDYAPENEVKIQTAKRRFFPPVCCVANDISFTDDSLSKSFDEKKTSKEIDHAKVPIKDYYAYEGIFSEDSLMTDDHSSDSKSPPGEWNLLSVAKDIPYIDETTSCTNASQYMDETSPCTNTSQNTDTVSEKKRTPVTSQECMQIVASNDIHKEPVKHVSWPDCISSCACLPSREEDDASFTVYSSSQESAKQENSPDEPRRDEQPAANVSVEFKITDDDDGIEFIAAKMPLVNSNANKANIRSSPDESDLSSPSAYDTDYIRLELKKLGFVTGPIAGTPTKKLYLRKLKRLKKTVSSPMKHFRRQPAFSSELEQVLNPDSKWTETLSNWSYLEQIMRDHFQDSSLSSTWRTGTAKTSFVYLLLDPRISINLPSRSSDMDLINVWQTFVRSIFYIGKGTRARPYEHLHEAFEMWHKTRLNVCHKNKAKINQILEIWKEGLGVVCVQTFHNVIPAEAFTREAAMIDAIGLSRLKNEKSGMYYGDTAKWNAKLKRRLGVFLLYRAMRIFIADNEVQLKPTDVN